MSLTTEELLRPRYKVIADYPESPYKIGDIEFNDTWSDNGSLADYPAIFRKLEWWEERDFDLTGMHVRFGELDKAHAYYKLIAKLDFPSETFWKMEGKFGEHGFPLNNSFPATIEEYNAFKSGKS